MNERLMAKGAIAERKRRVRELETEIEGLIVIVRNAIAPFLDFDMMKPELAYQSAKRLHECYKDRYKLIDEIKKLEADWGGDL